MPVESESEKKLRLHWEQRCEQRLDGLERFLDTFPESHHERVEPLLPLILERLIVPYGARGHDDDPAFVCWVVTRVEWGDDHPHNKPPPNPIPGTLLDLFLDNPDADTNGWCYCPHCHIQLPFTHQTGVYPNYVKSRCLADTCPVCRKDIPPPRTY